MRRPLPVRALLLVCLALVAAAGCGGSSSRVAGEGTLAEKALRTSLGGQRQEFVSLAAPSFLEEARREMPDISDDTLGGVLIAGSLDGLPFAGVKDATYQVQVQGERAVVHVWGVFLDDRGEEMIIAEAEAVRTPLIKENGRWYLDLLDL